VIYYAFIAFFTLGCALAWFFMDPNFLPMIPRGRKPDDPFAVAKQMAASRAVWVRANREAMVAWEGACDCRRAQDWATSGASVPPSESTPPDSPAR
jgi:hypothetical protein